jgi:low temperature requirement protein LtrA
VSGLAISWPVVAASILGLTLSGCIWWAYFDVVAIVAERVLRTAQGEERARIARDAYSYLHLPMIAGIVLVALGMKKVLGSVGDPLHHELSTPLPVLPLSAMYAGVSLYLLAHVAFRYRNWRHITVQRVVVAVLLIALIPVGALLPALAALALVTALMVALIAFEALHFNEWRERVRHEGEGVLPAE